MARDYAAPTEVTVNLSLGSDIIRFTVSDDGRGFDASAVFDETVQESANSARIQGLQTLKSKFELVGGSISVRSSESEGTSISAELPAGDY